MKNPQDRIPLRRIIAGNRQMLVLAARDKHNKPMNLVVDAISEFSGIPSAGQQISLETFRIDHPKHAHTWFWWHFAVGDEQATKTADLLREADIQIAGVLGRDFLRMSRAKLEQNEAPALLIDANMRLGAAASNLLRKAIAALPERMRNRIATKIQNLLRPRQT